MKRKPLKSINFSGWYRVDFYTLTSSKIEMHLSVSEDEYDIVLEAQKLSISGCPDYAKRGHSYSNQPIDHSWIPKYMIRPTKWGKEIFNINQAFILKLWDLVADDVRMKSLRNVSPPYNSSVQLK